MTETAEKKEPIVDAEFEEQSTQENKPVLVLGAEMYEDGSHKLIFNDPNGIAKDKPILLMGLASVIHTAIFEGFSPLMATRFQNLDTKLTDLTHLVKTMLLLKDDQSD